MDNHAKHSAESYEQYLKRVSDEAWTRGYGAPAHDPDPIVEAPEIAANHGLFADSGGAYDE